MRKATWSICLPGVCIFAPCRAAAAETEFDYRFQSYDEQDNRVDVEATYFNARHTTDSGFSLGIQYAHDALSGATPIGTYDPTNPNKWDYQEIEDVRNAVVIDIEQSIGNYSLGFEYSRSAESDYISNAYALKAAVQLFEKNTTLAFGISYADDLVLSTPGTTILEDRTKESFDLNLGITQILGPNTLLDFNLGYGKSRGYLSDPYRRISETDTFTIGGVTFTDTVVHPENRPDHQDRFVARAAVKHYIKPLNAALEGSYRFYATSDSLEGHTFELRWLQQVTDQVSVTPFLRYYIQSQADFYYPSLTGTPIDGHGNNDGSGAHYSSDYRLSDLDSWSYGIQFRYEPVQHLAFDLQLERYEMSGRDARTPAEFFPTADIISVGASYKF